jgi:hypothetical protein
MEHADPLANLRANSGLVEGKQWIRVEGKQESGNTLTRLLTLLPSTAAGCAAALLALTLDNVFCSDV